MLMMRIDRVLGLAAAALLLTLAGCRRAAPVRITGDAVYSPRYAAGFSILATEGASTVVEIRNPWQGAGDAVCQIFVARGGEVPPEGFRGTVVEAPAERIVCFSTSYVAFLDAVGAADAVVGVSGAEYVSDSRVAERYRAGLVREVGYDSGVNFEVLAAMRPDLVLLYGLGGENTSLTDKLDELGIPYMYVGEFSESDPLGRSEWVVAMGEVTDRRGAAEEVFDAIASDYEAIRSAVAESDERPGVMINAPYRDVWFAPGDDSYMTRLLRDAGGEYLFAGQPGAASRPISNEAAYVAALRADVWLNPNMTRTIADLKAENPKFADIPCVAEGRVYNSTRRMTASGGSDFWESGALRADRVLLDLAMCLHPDFVPDPRWAVMEDSADGVPYYFERLQ